MKNWTFEDAGLLADEICDRYNLDPVRDLTSVSIDIWSGRLQLHTERPLPGVEYQEIARSDSNTHFRAFTLESGAYVEAVYLVPHGEDTP